MFKLIRHVCLMHLCLYLTVCCQTMASTATTTASTPKKTTAFLTRHPHEYDIAPLIGTLTAIENWIGKIAEFQIKNLNRDPQAYQGKKRFFANKALKKILWLTEYLKYLMDMQQRYMNNDKFFVWSF